MAYVPSRELIARMRAWAARDEFMFVVEVGERAIPFFKDQIDATETDEDLTRYVAERLAAVVTA